MQWTEFIYYAKKAFAVFPGLSQPISAPAFREHYARRKRDRRTFRTALDCLVGMLFHAWVPLRARSVQKQFGLDPAWRRRACAIAHERFADPNDLALFRIQHADELDAYIRRFEDAAFNKIVNPHGWSRNCVLVDKRRFYQRCVQHGIPHPTVIAVLDRRQVVQFEAPNGRPLIVKPSHGEGGRGVSRLPEAMSHLTSPTAFRDALAPYVSRQERVWIVQRAVRNHPVLEPYAVDALSTVRMTTMRNEHGDAELVNAVLRMASLRGPVIDNMKAGGLIMSLCLTSGRGHFACRGYGGGDYTHHPVTGAALSELHLPDWPDAVQQVCAAHMQAFPQYGLIGWDIAFTPSGPLVIEGNAKPGVLMPQRSARHGLADQRYGELLAWLLANRGTLDHIAE